ncbi:sulfotransferase family protein, partial [Streptomyces galilaeus]
ELLTRAFFADRSGWGCDSPDPIFIVGLPRAGSTLIEQILASHSQVEGTMELADIPRMVLAMRDYPASLTRLTAAQARAMGERYLAETRVYR